LGVFANVPLVADTSALTKWHHLPAQVHQRFARAARNGELRISPVVRLEFLHDAFDVNAFDVRDYRLSALSEIPITPADCAAAIQAMRDLAHRQPIMQGYHKVKAADALIAASASANGCGVLHYDRDFERLAQVLPLVQVWIAPRGSLP
jgi:predicted nucleic acid-binding protein